MRKEFEVHILNEVGKNKARLMAQSFSDLLVTLESLCGPGGREMAIVRTKLEEACFFAKRSLACNPENQEPTP